MPSSPVFFSKVHWFRFQFRFMIYLSSSFVVFIPCSCSTPGHLCTWAYFMSNKCRWAGNLCSFWIRLVTLSWGCLSESTPFKGEQKNRTLLAFWMRGIESSVLYPAPVGFSFMAMKACSPFLNLLVWPRGFCHFPGIWGWHL